MPPLVASLAFALPLCLAMITAIADATAADQHISPFTYIAYPPHQYLSPPPPPYVYQSPFFPPYQYPSPSPPLPPYNHQSPPISAYKPPSASPYPSRPPFKAVVTGIVYCDVCKDGKLKKPLKGVTVGVFCWNGKWEESFYGTTNDKGAFRIMLKGFDYVGCGGAKACAAKLISASYNTHCTQPSNLHGGQEGGHLHVKGKTEHGATLKAGPFAYSPVLNYPKCYAHAPKGPVYGTVPGPCTKSTPYDHHKKEYLPPQAPLPTFPSPLISSPPYN